MSYLVKVSGHYYFRVRVPRELRAVFKRREIRKALKTKQLKNARSLAKVLSYETERIFTLVRCGVLADEQVEKIVQSFLRDTLSNFERGRAVGGAVPETQGQLRKLERAYEIMEEEDKRSLLFNKLVPVLHRKLARNDGRRRAVPVLDDFEKVPPFGVC